MARIAFSYSHVDEGLRNHLDVHLAGLKRRGLIDTWHDRQLVAGDELDPAIDKNFQEADVILLLVSPEFIASNYCYEVEMTRALERHAKGEVRVIPVILRPCDWHDLPFGKLLVSPTDGKPIVKFPTLDEGFLEVVQAIKGAISTLGNSPSITEVTARSGVRDLASKNTHVNGGGRSSNLRILKKFSDKEKDQFLREAFLYISRYFENSLIELQKRNAEIEAAFQQRDANGFEATVYVNGKRRCHCGIWLSTRGFSRAEILFGGGGITEGSYNESLSLADDGYTQGLMPLGMMSMHEKKMLTFEGAAETYWSAFIEPLQR
jgi:hypothetical protein